MVTPLYQLERNINAWLQSTIATVSHSPPPPPNKPYCHRSHRDTATAVGAKGHCKIMSFRSPSPTKRRRMEEGGREGEGEDDGGRRGRVLDNVSQLSQTPTRGSHQQSEGEPSDIENETPRPPRRGSLISPTWSASASTFVAPVDTSRPEDLLLSDDLDGDNGKDNDKRVGHWGTLFNEADITINADEIDTECLQRPPGTAASVASTTTTTTTTSETSQRSGKSSLVRQELAMRYNLDVPLERRSLLSQTSLSIQNTLPASVVELIRDLRMLEARRGIIPAELRDVVMAEQTFLDPVDDAMFSPPAGFASGSSPDRHYPGGTELKERLLYQHRRLEDICEAARECSNPARPVHEAEWNDTVHSPLLRLAIEDLPRLKCRNLTSVQIEKPFRDTASSHSHNGKKVDYGIFLAPRRKNLNATHPEEHNQDSLLRSRIASYIQHDPQPYAQVNHLVAFEPDRPLAISVETKRLASGVEKADVQLAIWVRAQMRMLDQVAQRVNKIRAAGAASAGGGHRNEPSSAATAVAAAAPSNEVVVLPLVKVTGMSWEVSFAIREHPTVVIYESVKLGDIDTLTGCYRVLCSLQRLGLWASQTHWTWWENILEGA